MGGGDHHHAPAVPEPPYGKFLSQRSGLCPPGYSYPREVWYTHGGPYSDPKNWRINTALTLGGVAVLMYSAFVWSNANEVRYRAPKMWVPSMLWNDRIPDPVDFRGRTLDRVTGKPKEDTH